MFEYNLKLLRSKDVLQSREVAIQILNSYKYHCIGQPIVLYYRDEAEAVVKTLFAVGKNNGNGEGCGADYYDIVNSESSRTIYPQTLYWKDLDSM